MKKPPSPRLSDLSEERVLELLLPELPRGKNVVIGPGDDCAAIRLPGSRDLLLLKTDCVVEGVHYLREEDPARVGRKALCRAISDIGAMGGRPDHALVTIFTPKDREVSYWQAFYRGMARAARRYGVGIVGGETSHAEQAAVTVALTGRVEARQVVTRAGGRAGHLLFVTGRLGGSLAGKHLDFEPRLAEGQWLAKNGSASAMMDLSDGLAADLPRLAAASGCAFALDPTSLPRNPGRTIEQALTDGEDYELLLAVPPKKAALLPAAWKRAFPRLRLTQIGCLLKGGAKSTALGAGFDHFFDCKPDRKG
ncbi:thiamine-phosphate kinase [soil metagenome]